jgi:hypothetical protein
MISGKIDIDITDIMTVFKNGNEAPKPPYNMCSIYKVAVHIVSTRKFDGTLKIDSHAVQSVQ